MVRKQAIYLLEPLRNPHLVRSLSLLEWPAKDTVHFLAHCMDCDTFYPGEFQKLGGGTGPKAILYLPDRTVPGSFFSTSRERDPRLYQFPQWVYFPTLSDIHNSVLWL